MNRMNGFHDFRRLVVRNHNAVKTFRRLFGVQMEEEPPTVIEVIEDDDTDADAEPMEIKQEFEAEESKLADQIKTEHEQGVPPVKDTVKEVDVYHLDGKLATVVVKEEQLSPVKEEKLSPVKSVPQVSASSSTGTICRSFTRICNLFINKKGSRSSAANYCKIFHLELL